MNVCREVYEHFWRHEYVAHLGVKNDIFTGNQKKIMAFLTWTCQKTVQDACFSGNYSKFKNNVLVCYRVRVCLTSMFVAETFNTVLQDLKLKKS